MKKLWSFTLILLLSFFGTGIAHAGIIEDSVRLERSYVPALALTNQPDKPQPKVEESVKRLAAGWKVFTQSVAKLSEKEQSVMGGAIKASSPKIEEALRLAAADKRKEAHNALEFIRMSFMEARKSLGLKFLPDTYTAFHEHMEEFVDLTAKAGYDKKDLLRRLDELSTLWKEVENAGLDTSVFQVNAERAAKYGEQVKKVRSIIAQLGNIIESGNQETLSKTSIALKGNFSQAYFVFGEFTDL
jgi:hypothetical protein